MPKTTFTRFHDAQKQRANGFKQALQEIQAGHKTSHWIWYIFPQLKALGFSAPAKIYGIEDLDEACCYLEDKELFSNYLQITKEIARQMQQGISIRRLMGSAIDAQKLMSSLTLFQAAAYTLAKGNSGFAYQELAQLCERILSAAGHESLYPCQKTLTLIANQRKIQANMLNKITGIETQFLTVTQMEQPQLKVTSKLEMNNDFTSLKEELSSYVKKRANEWYFHRNFLGLAAAIYLLSDLFCGTEYYNSKSRAIKISAAGKFKQWLDSTDEPSPSLTQSEHQALSEGRLGQLILKHGGMEQIIAHKHADKLAGTSAISPNPTR